MNKFVRTPGQVEELLREYKNEIKHVKDLLETEEDLRTRSLLQEGLMENIDALKNLEKFLEENPNIFK